MISAILPFVSPLFILFYTYLLVYPNLTKFRIIYVRITNSRFHNHCHRHHRCMFIWRVKRKEINWGGREKNYVRIYALGTWVLEWMTRIFVYGKRKKRWNLKHPLFLCDSDCIWEDEMQSSRMEPQKREYLKCESENNVIFQTLVRSECVSFDKKFWKQW